MKTSHIVSTLALGATVVVAAPIGKMETRQLDGLTGLVAPVLSVAAPVEGLASSLVPIKKRQLSGLLAPVSSVTGPIDAITDDLVPVKRRQLDAVTGVLAPVSSLTGPIDAITGNLVPLKRRTLTPADEGYGGSISSIGELNHVRIPVNALTPFPGFGSGGSGLIPGFGGKQKNEGGPEKGGPEEGDPEEGSGDEPYYPSIKARQVGGSIESLIAPVFASASGFLSSFGGAQQQASRQPAPQQGSIMVSSNPGIPHQQNNVPSKASTVPQSPEGQSAAAFTQSTNEGSAAAQAELDQQARGQSSSGQ